MPQKLTEATLDLLTKLEKVVDEVKGALNRYEYPDDLRTVLVIGYIDQAIEHHAALLLLIRSGFVGSAFALLRSIFESLYRAAWILICATDEQVRNFEKKDELPLTIGEMAAAIDKVTEMGTFFTDLKNRAWGALNSYTHTGLLQLGRRFTGHKLEPAYSEAEISEVTTTATTCVILLVRPFFAAHRHEEEAEMMDKLGGSYGPAAECAEAREHPKVVQGHSNH